MKDFIDEISVQVKDIESCLDKKDKLTEDQMATLFLACFLNEEGSDGLGTKEN